MKLYLLVFIIIFSLASCKLDKSSGESSSTEASFSFDEINNIPRQEIKHNIFTADDGVDLAYYEFITKSEIKQSLVFLHGGGAYSLAGYEILAQKLSESHNISVYLLDLRGHGKSQGPRGDSPSKEQVWDDIHSFIEFVKNENKNYPLFLGGHSSGCGLILNYINYISNIDIDGYIFISPEFGYKSKTANRKIKTPFAKVKSEVFADYYMSNGKEYGNDVAVILNYPEDILISFPLLVNKLTVNMANAQTPKNPQKQFSKINKPFGIFVGNNDELFIPENIIRYAEYSSEEIRSRSISRIIESENHLSILIDADKLIIETIAHIISE